PPRGRGSWPWWPSWPAWAWPGRRGPGPGRARRPTRDPDLEPDGAPTLLPPDHLVDPRPPAADPDRDLGLGRHPARGRSLARGGLARARGIRADRERGGTGGGRGAPDPPGGPWPPGRAAPAGPAPRGGARAAVS